MSKGRNKITFTNIGNILIRPLIYNSSKYKGVWVEAVGLQRQKYKNVSNTIPKHHYGNPPEMAIRVNNVTGGLRWHKMGHN